MKYELNPGTKREAIVNSKKGVKKNPSLLSQDGDSALRALLS